jgi:hypothetical protein
MLLTEIGYSNKNLEEGTRKRVVNNNHGRDRDRKEPSWQ